MTKFGESDTDPLIHELGDPTAVRHEARRVFTVVTNKRPAIPTAIQENAGQLTDKLV